MAATVAVNYRVDVSLRRVISQKTYSDLDPAQPYHRNPERIEKRFLAPTTEEAISAAQHYLQTVEGWSDGGFTNAKMCLGSVDASSETPFEDELTNCRVVYEGSNGLAGYPQTTKAGQRVAYELRAFMGDAPQVPIGTYRLARFEGPSMDEIKRVMTDWVTRVIDGEGFPDVTWVRLYRIVYDSSLAMDPDGYHNALEQGNLNNDIVSLVVEEEVTGLTFNRWKYV